ncbi:CheY-like superfamily [Russula earlei]|uniref:CheY-like superfamily n=1 Tax=Russula earlei TaxID=71964 RepID=A0ACC0U2L2_9AGAM|nr:CheY-like superfamily [Russula earlei]
MIRIALVDDHALVRQLLKQLIEVTLGWNVIIEATNGKDCLNQLALALIPPDVVLMDVAMPVMDGLSSLAHAHVMVDMIRKGAMGFLTKSTSPQTLVQAVQSVMNNTPYIEDCLFEEVANDIGDSDPKPLLSNKQKTVPEIMRY